MTPTKQLVRILLFLNLLSLSAVAFLILGGAQREPGSHMTELSVERINIVSPEGKTVMAISNKQRVAPPVMGGREYALGVSSGRESMAGMVFFNDEGDEMGGLMFNSFRRPDGKYAGIGHLSFDRYNDNQVLALQYKENAQTVQAGLTLYERPGTGTFQTSLNLVEEYLTAPPRTPGRDRTQPRNDASCRGTRGRASIPGKQRPRVARAPARLTGTCTRQARRRCNRCATA